MTVIDCSEVCECGFAPEACAGNPCLRKKVHLAGLTPDSKWPDGSAPRSTDQETVTLDYDNGFNAGYQAGFESGYEAGAQPPALAFVCPCCGTRGTTDGKTSSVSSTVRDAE